jgi:ceramide glucosyltransferase
MHKILLTAVALMTSLSAAYCLLCIMAAAAYTRRRNRPLPVATTLPPISILKPLKGTDPEMYASLRSHCTQNYPKYEILFGIGDLEDPAAEVVECLRREFPDHAIRLVHCHKNLGPNGKVSSLAQLAANAKYDMLLVNDSDIRVEPDYLRTVATELQQPDVGMVTCLYRGVPARTIASKLESLGISTDFVPGVLVASLIEGGIRFALGSTLALRKEHLQAIGGFESLTQYLADDYQLGLRISEKKLKIELSREIVDTYLPAYSCRAFITHQLRWMRTIRASRPAGYAGLPFTFTLPLGILSVLLAADSLWAWALFAVAASLRLTAAVTTGVFVLRDRQPPSLMWLLPLRDLIAPFLWIAGHFGRKIVWRGKVFDLDHGKLTPRE